jgi:hypothetical protein
MEGTYTEEGFLTPLFEHDKLAGIDVSLGCHRNSALEFLGG